MFIPGATVLPPGNAVYDRPYRIIGPPPTYHFNLADTNGHRVAITALANNGAINWMFYRSSHDIEVDGASFGMAYVGIFYEVGAWAKICDGYQRFRCANRR